MELQDLLGNHEYVKTIVGILIFIFFASIKFTKKEINLWMVFGRAINGELFKKIDEVEKKLDNHILDSNFQEVRNRRQRILRFDDYIRNGSKPSFEYANEMMDEVDKYKKYCIENPNYPNSKAEAAIENIIEYYNELKENTTHKS